MGETRRAGSASAPFKVLVVGGSYGGLAAALNLADLCQGKPPRAASRYSGSFAAPPKPVHVDITIVDERDGFYHVIGSPLVFASKAYAAKAWVPYSAIPALQAAPNIKTVHGSVASVDLASKTAVVQGLTASAAATAATAATTATTFAYDFIIVAAGLRRAFPVVPQAKTKAAFLAEVAAHVDAIAPPPPAVVLVVGGGAVGVEMAAELKFAQPQTRVVLAHSRPRLLSSEPLPDALAGRVLDVLRAGGVEVLLDHRRQATRDGGDNTKEVAFANGTTLRATAVVEAISKSVPSTRFLPPEALDKAGYVRIRPTLFFPQDVPNADSALASGDLAAWPGIKRCGGAMHMGFYAAINAHQRMQALAFGTAPAFLALDAMPPVIAIALGDDAVACHSDGAVESGPAMASRFFQDDVGFNICWEILGLGAKPDAEG